MSTTPDVLPPGPEARTGPIASPLTKIVATIGPASADPETIGKLIDAGARVFRLNFGHGTFDDHAERLRAIRAVSADRERPTAVLGDLQGPKIRIGTVADGGVDVAAGSAVIVQREPVVTSAPAVGAAPRLSTTCPAIVDDVRPGQRLLVNDGAIRMLVVEARADELVCTVTQGGRLESNKGVNLPDTDLSVPSLDERDWRDVAWAVEHDLDFLALSFVRRAADVLALREGIERIAAERGRSGLRLPIISKIEVPAALRVIDGIVDASDGIMIARGDLGVEMDLAEVPVIQKRLVRIAQSYGKPCIVATQMFESMIQLPAPTRAEVNDVANAIFDQADAIMLSGETAVGRHPVLAVEYMRRIAECTEAEIARRPRASTPPARLVESRYRTAALAHGVWTVAQDIDARIIVVWSQSGGGARYLSQNNFHVPILAVTSDERAARQMQLLRGVSTRCMPVPDGLAEFTRMMDQHLLAAGRAEHGDMCILVAGEPLGEVGVTNTLAIHAIGDPGSGYAKH